jgi:hypothetical protein
LLDGFHPALIVSVIASVLGIAAMALRWRRQPEPAVEAVPETEVASEAEAA